MYSHGVTINVPGYQSERIDVTYPFDIPPTEQGYNDAVFWVKSRLQLEIDAIVQRERARGYEIDPPRVLPLGDASSTLPPVGSSHNVPSRLVDESINQGEDPLIIPSHIRTNDSDSDHSTGNG